MNRRPSDLDAKLIAWLEQGPTSGPAEVLSSTFARARSTSQDRVGLRRLTQPTRFHAMNTTLKVAAVAAFALAIGVTVLPRSPDIASAPAPSPSPTPQPLRQGALLAGDYTVVPFEGDAWAPCGPAEDPCPEAARDDGLRFTFTLPDGWAGAPLGSDIWLAIENNSGPDGAGMLIGRGGWSWSNPCGESGDPDIPVGPTVDDFVDALVTHPSLDVSEPVDIMLAGYPGKYLSLQGPSDRTDCPYFQAWDGTHYAQGDSNLWRVWVIDVDGVRVVIHGSEFPDTAPERSAELAAIVESFQIDTVPPPAASEAPMADEVQATDATTSASSEAGMPTVGTDLPVGATSGVIDTPIGLARRAHMAVLDGDRLSPADLPELLEARPPENLIPMAPVADGIVALDLDTPSGPAIAWRLDQVGATS